MQTIERPISLNVCQSHFNFFWNIQDYRIYTARVLTNYVWYGFVTVYTWMCVPTYELGIKVW